MEQEFGKIVLNEQIRDYLAEVIKETVNGKIDKQGETIKNFVESFYEASKNQVDANRNIERKLHEYIERDEAWKKENEPYLKGLANLSWGAKSIVKVSIFVSSLGGAWLLIKQFLK